MRAAVRRARLRRGRSMRHTSAALIHGLRVLEQYAEPLVGEGFERSRDGDLPERLVRVVNALKPEPGAGARLLGGERDDGPPAFLFIGDGPGSHGMRALYGCQRE